MSTPRWALWAGGAALAGGFVYASLAVFGFQFATGEVYPDYSSLRSDPAGTKLLFDSLAKLPGLAVERNFQPFAFLPEAGATILMPACGIQAWGDDPRPFWKSVEKLAEQGDRVVLSLVVPVDEKAEVAKQLEEAWHVRLGVDTAMEPARRYIAEAKGWEPFYSDEGKLLAVEKGFGKGSVVLFADASLFTNRATVAMDRLGPVAAAIGSNSRIIFDEQHLGIAETGSVVEMARRFHLMGLVAGLAVFAALLLWRNASEFPPPAGATVAAPLSGRTSHSGLLTLLRRYIPPSRLPEVCWQEWLNGNRGQATPERVQRAEAIARSGAAPLERVREIQAVLHAKGEL